MAFFIRTGFEALGAGKLAGFLPGPVVLDPDAPAVEYGKSSRGTMSMRKSNISDLLNAFAMSARERVRRLLESAIMNARAVISEMKTMVGSVPAPGEKPRGNLLSQALQKRIGATSHS